MYRPRYTTYSKVNNVGTCTGQQGGEKPTAGRSSAKLVQRMRGTRQAQVEKGMREQKKSRHRL